MEAALPPEAEAAGGETLVACAVRLPNGRRIARRFRRSDPAQRVFEFVDAMVRLRMSVFGTGHWGGLVLGFIVRDEV